MESVNGHSECVLLGAHHVIGSSLAWTAWTAATRAESEVSADMVQLWMLVEGGVRRGVRRCACASWWECRR